MKRERDKTKQREYQRRYYERHREAILVKRREYSRQYRAKNREQMNARARERDSHRREKNRARSAAWRQKNADRYKESLKRSARENRLLCLKHYGGDPPRCACCGEHRVRFLHIDHIGGGGAQHLQSLRSHSISQWLIAEQMPNGFRVLCANCNMALGLFGRCPHQDEGTSALSDDGPQFQEILTMPKNHQQLEMEDG